MTRSIFILLIAFTLLCPLPVLGQSQRLGIPAGSFSLKPNGSKSVRGYCMDFGVPAPKPKTSLGNVLTAPSQIVVRDNAGKTFTIAEALESNLLRIEATSKNADKTVEKVLDDGTASFTVHFTLRELSLGNKWSDLYKDLKSKQFTDAPEALQKYISAHKEESTGTLKLLRKWIIEDIAEGDGEHVRFVNQSDQNLEINVKSAAVFSETHKKLSDVVLDVPPSSSDSSHSENQRRIWLDNSALHASISGKFAEEYILGSEKRSGVKTFVRDGDDTFVLGQVEYPRMNPIIELRLVRKGKVERIAEGRKAIDEFSATLNRITAKNSDGNFVLTRIDIPRFGEDGVRIQLGKKAIELPLDEFNKFMEGGELPESIRREVDLLPPTANIVMWRDPLKLSQGTDYIEANGKPYRAQYSIAECVIRLDTALGNKRNCYLDDFRPLVKSRVQSAPTVRGPEDLALISDKASFPVRDFGIIDNIEEVVSECGVAVFRDMNIQNLGRRNAFLAPNLIAITGHKDEKFREYMSTIVETGLIKDKVLVVYSCYETSDETMNSTLLRHENAPKAIVFIKDTISPSAVESVLVSLATILKDNKTESLKVKQLLDKAVEEALTDPNETEVQKVEIKKIRKSVNQVSMNSFDNWQPVLMG
ncbi:hypothetical protein ACYFX5_19920 [Bremerella sp. T1]|uniref:hypothetical protein n=1 Tax=Bremerella sp. TYQ1 TaxID=3119568 RepID=UPI001CCA72F7|nr:hypothetical protein [Bremerella volcania]UBM35312.1 hypothetical protein LA756_21870 [Bremerella volcania]